MAAEWQPEACRVLHDLLTAALRSPSANVSRKLQVALSQLGTVLCNPLYAEHKSTTARKELQQGTIVINGRRQQANTQFVEAAIFLSDVLGIHETRAAALFQYACAQRARYEGWSPIKIAVDAYHTERGYMLESVVLLVTRFVAGKAPEESIAGVKTFLEGMMELTPSYAETLLKSMTEMESRIQELIRDPTLNGALTQTKMQSLGVEDDIVALHTKFLEKERTRLGDIFYYVTARWKLGSEECVKVLRTLQKAETPNLVTISLLCAFMINFDRFQSTIDPDLEEKEDPDAGEINLLQREIQSTAWVLPGLRGVVWTQWACFLHGYFLNKSDAAPRDDGLHVSARMQQDTVSRKWMESVGRHPDAYNFLVDFVIPFQRSKEEIRLAEVRGTPTLHIDEELREEYIFRVEHLIDGILLHLRRYLKEVKNADEDATRAAEEPIERGRFGSSHAPVSTSLSPPVGPVRPTAWEALLSLVTILYRDRPDAGMSFWNDPRTDRMDYERTDGSFPETLEKQAFVKMAADVTTSRFLKAFIDMLASLATGKVSAQEVHIRLNAEVSQSQLGKVLWTTFFRSLTGAIDVLSRGAPELKPDELGLIMAFLRLLRQVVKFSYHTRRVLCDNQQLRALSTLFRLLVSRVPVELKGALLESIAAFCIPIGNSYAIQSQVWLLLEQTQIVPTKPPNRGAQFTNGFYSGNSQPMPISDERRDGIAYDLEERERPIRTYPETLAFLRLLAVLLHGPKNAQMASVLEQLGLPERAPGIGPYIRFVADHVFLTAQSREFNYEDERWEMISTCLTIFEKSLQLFDLGSLMSERWDGDKGTGSNAEQVLTGHGGFGPNILQNARSLVLHPGFEIESRILNDSKFTKKLFELLSIGVDSVNESIDNVPLRGRSVLLIFRILLRVLQNQRVFLEILAPALLEARAGSAPGLSASMCGLDQLLACNKDVIVHIVRYLLCADDAIALYAVRIVNTLSQSPFLGSADGAGRVNRLVSILQSSEHRDMLVRGFVKRLEMEEEEQNAAVIESADIRGTEGGTTSSEGQDAKESLALVAENWQDKIWPDYQVGLVHTVRMAILDLLLVNVTAVRPSPTIAHFLLGYTGRISAAQSSVNDPSGLSGEYNCLHAILNLIRVRARDTARPHDALEFEDVRAQPLFVTHPRLAERCYRLIYHLCADSFTSASTMRYLRNTEDYFYRQLQAMPVDKVEISEDSDIENSILLATLLQRAWLMKSVALELHVTTGAQQRSHAQKLVNVLYVEPMQTTASQQPEDEDDMDLADEDYDGMGPSSNYPTSFEQPLTKIMEILNSMSFHDTDAQSLSVSLPTRILEMINLEDFRRDGIYDIRAVHHHLVAISEKSDPKGEALGETRRILSDLLRSNFGQEIGSARCHCAQAWGQMVQVTLTRCFSLIPADVREGKLFEILSTLLPKMNYSPTAPSIAEGMSTVVLVLLNGMQKDRTFQSLIQTATLQSESTISTIRLPTETLQQVVLRGILDGIGKSAASLTMRGNLYVALLKFLQYTKPEELELLQRSVLGHSISNGQAENDNTLLVARRERLLQGNYLIIDGYGQKLLDTICPDATGGNGVWNIVSFAVLDAIYELASWSKKEQRTRGNGILDILVQRNFLGDVVRTIKHEDDRALQDLLRNEPDAMNSQLIFEVKMAFLLRLSLTSDGARKLLEYGVFEALSDCRFVDLRPDVEARITDYDDIVPPAHERYHEVLLPTLELILSVAQHTHDDYSAPARVAGFVVAHQHVLAKILKDSSQYITLASLKELELTTGLLSYLAPRQELMEKELPVAGHSSFHALLLALLNKYASPNRWISQLKPISRVEQEKHRTMVAFLGRPTDVSNFRQEAETLVTSICRNLLSYCRIASEWREAEGGLGKSIVPRPPLFTPSFTMENDRIPSAGLVAGHPRPSMYTICAFTSRVVQTLMQSIEDYKHLSLKIAETHRLSVDEVNEITRDVTEFEEELSAAQRRQWALLQLDKTLKKKADDVWSFLYLLEHLLLLLWRHLVTFIAEYHVMPPRSRIATEKENLGPQINTCLAPIITRVQALELNEDIVGSLGNVESRKTFLSMLVRQLRELLQSVQQD
ncbi:hypothetical protein SpCBS45565_g04779 [Spizellomyces sp. 'palustris']|nr:hypothetical protein SpCBS45565_g04779 [Spizellomyces sp. 'palustris']